MDSRARRLTQGLLATSVVIFLVALGFSLYALWPRAAELSSERAPSTTVAGLAIGPTAESEAATPSSEASSLTSAPAPEQSTTVPTTGAATTTTLEPPAPPRQFDGALAMAHVRALAEGIGARAAGSDAEDAAVAYAAGCLRDLGYAVDITEVPLPDGRVSHNVRAARAGASGATILLGAHLDSMAPSPGANDNASGVAVALELARDLARADVVPTVEFVLFGTEEVIDGHADHHHYGSRTFVDRMTPVQVSTLAGMISVDMIAYGSDLVVRTMGRGPRQLADMLLDYASAHAIAAAYARDPGKTGWSDHEAFEDAGFAVAWLERTSDPAHHTGADTYGHCDPALLEQTGELLLGFLIQLTERDLDVLRASRKAG